MLVKKISEINKDFSRRRRVEYKKYYAREIAPQWKINLAKNINYDDWEKWLTNKFKDWIVRSSEDLNNLRVNMNKELVKALDDVWVSSINIEKIILKNKDLLEKSKTKIAKSWFKTLDQTWWIDKSNLFTSAKKQTESFTTQQIKESPAFKKWKISNILQKGWRNKTASNDPINPDTIKKVS